MICLPSLAVRRYCNRAAEPFYKLMWRNIRKPWPSGIVRALSGSAAGRDGNGFPLRLGDHLPILQWPMHDEPGAFQCVFWKSSKLNVLIRFV